MYVGSYVELTDSNWVTDYLRLGSQTYARWLYWLWLRLRSPILSHIISSLMDYTDQNNGCSHRGKDVLER